MSIKKSLAVSAFKAIGKISPYNAWQQFENLSASQWWPREKLEAYQKKSKAADRETG